ncbi:hypothetical protein O988_04145, partial [Pseudogymnoascus sp. VKM F-3808]
FSPDSKQIASGSKDKTIKLWDARTGDLQKTLAGHSGWVLAVAFSPDSKQIASGSEDNTIKLWDTRTGNFQKTLAGHSGWVRAVAFSPDGKQIVSSSNDNTIKLWNVAKSFKVSNWLGNTVGSYFKFYIWQEIETLQAVSFLKSSTNGSYLVTNLGHINIESIPANTQSLSAESLENLWVGNQWIYYGAMPVFLLPSSFEVQCHDFLNVLHVFEKTLLEAGQIR